ncbi:MAG: hypothetical protein AVDCRST_MAG93-5156, partial [uncultured Chloroflexia bacterium]
DSAIITVDCCFVKQQICLYIILTIVEGMLGLGRHAANGLRAKRALHRE